MPDDRKPSVEEVAREFEKKWLASPHGYFPEFVAQWALRFRAQGVREALERAALHFEKGGALAEGSFRLSIDWVVGELRRRAEIEVPDA